MKNFIIKNAKNKMGEEKLQEINFAVFHKN